MARFTREMSIFEALAAHPGAREVFERHGMACSLCIGAQSETIEAGAILHQVDPDEVVAELNRLPEPGAGGEDGDARAEGGARGPR